MATINSETRYTVALDKGEQSLIANGGEVQVDLPSGDKITLTSGGVQSDSATEVPTRDRDVDVTDGDVDMDDIEELVKDTPDNVREVEGSPVEEDTGNAGDGGGMISIDRS